MPKVLILDDLSAEGVEVFRAEGIEVDVKPAQKPDELAAIIGAYDGLVVRSATKVTAEAIAAADNLKVIGRAGAGTDNIDKDAATNRGIVVMNTPGGNTISTCEHTLALLMALCRQIPRAHASMEAGRWDRKAFMGAELYGKTLGVVGVGRIGGEVAKRAQAFEMKVIAFDPLLTPLKAEALGVELVTVDELIERADFITIHAPKMEKTVNMIAAPQFKKMKPTCRIVNCARGGIVNEADLAEALRNKTIAGAALDVYTTEPLVDNPFIGLDNIVMTPHLAASTDEAQLTVAVDIAKQMCDYLKTGAITGAVNVPSLDAETRRQLKPLLFLADRMGRFLSQHMHGRPSSIELEYAGDIGVTDTYPVTSSIIAGFLANMVENVNMVNAPVHLKNHGIESVEKRKAASPDYAFEIGVTVVTDQDRYTIKGTLFQNKDPRIISIDGTRVDAHPLGEMLVCFNEDKPLVIGSVCVALGEAGVNIANLTLGRDEKGGRAMTVLNLDTAPSPETLTKIRALPHVLKAQPISLPREVN
jgi:D-3-phosphoglycerate dehydrogenase